jgi:hypothetical protein
MAVEINALPDADAVEVAELAGSLRAELLETDVEAVELARHGPAPAGAKAVDALAVGMLVVQLSQAAPALHAVVAAVRDWLSRRRVRSVKVELDGDVLELSQASGDEQRRLVDAWIARQAARPVNSSG